MRLSLCLPTGIKGLHHHAQHTAVLSWQVCQNAKVNNAFYELKHFAPSLLGKSADTLEALGS